MSNQTAEEIDIPKEDLQKINSIIGKATYNDYHWWNLIGIIKNLMEEHAEQRLTALKEKVNNRIEMQEEIRKTTSLGVERIEAATAIYELRRVLTLIEELQ